MTVTLEEYFFKEPTSVVKLQLIEISHPHFSTTYRVTNTGTDIQVVHEDSSGPHTYTYVPMQIRTMGSSGDMDQELEVTFGDLGELLPAELQNVIDANGMQTKPILVYREYLSSELDPIIPGVLNGPVFGPFTLNINAISFNSSGATFVAKPVAFNRGRTGDVYDVGRFPMLRGFV
jgi:hypothetical protein